MKNDKAIEVRIRLGKCQDDRGIVGPFRATSTGYVGVISEEVLKEDGDGGVAAAKRVAAKVLEWAVDSEKQIDSK